MMLVNGLRVLFGLGINGLVDIDQAFDATSENPQSGVAIDTHLQNTFADHTPTDQRYAPNSTNAQSGRAVAEAVAGAVAQCECTIKAYSTYLSDDQTTYYFNLAKDENKYYTVHSVMVNIAGGDMLFCDVSINDYMASGGSGVCDVTVTLAEPVGMPIVIRILYTEV